MSLYDEYHPYGTSAFRSWASSAEVSAKRKRKRKRYRYSDKERDEETGLYYHGARYYAPWLGRWTVMTLAEVRRAGWRYLPRRAIRKKVSRSSTAPSACTRAMRRRASVCLKPRLTRPVKTLWARSACSGLGRGAP